MPGATLETPLSFIISFGSSPSHCLYGVASSRNLNECVGFASWWSCLGKDMRTAAQQDWVFISQVNALSKKFRLFQFKLCLKEDNAHKKIIPWRPEEQYTKWFIWLPAHLRVHHGPSPIALALAELVYTGSWLWVSRCWSSTRLSLLLSSKLEPTLLCLQFLESMALGIAVLSQSNPSCWVSLDMGLLYLQPKSNW